MIFFSIGLQSFLRKIHNFSPSCWKLNGGKLYSYIDQCLKSYELHPVHRNALHHLRKPSSFYWKTRCATFDHRPAKQTGVSRTQKGSFNRRQGRQTVTFRSFVAVVSFGFFWKITIFWRQRNSCCNIPIFHLMRGWMDLMFMDPKDSYQSGKRLPTSSHHPKSSNIPKDSLFPCRISRNHP